MAASMTASGAPTTRTSKAGIRRALSLRGTTSVDLRDVRLLGAAMLAVAAVRPLVPFDFVPPCPLRTITGVPCPLCGMTRGVTAVVHGEVGRAVVLNPGSLLAVAGVVLVLLAWRSKRTRVRIPVWMVASLLGVLWCWQLFKYATGRPL